MFTQNECIEEMHVAIDREYLTSNPLYRGNGTKYDVNYWYSHIESRIWVFH